MRLATEADSGSEFSSSSTCMTSKNQFGWGKKIQVGCSVGVLAGRLPNHSDLDCSFLTHAFLEC